MQVFKIDKEKLLVISIRSRVIIPPMSCVVCAITVVKTARQALDLFYIASSVSLASHSSLPLLSSYLETIKRKKPIRTSSCRPEATPSIHSYTE